jgi:hypothetical protein
MAKRTTTKMMEVGGVHKMSLTTVFDPEAQTRREVAEVRGEHAPQKSEPHLVRRGDRTEVAARTRGSSNA